MSSRARGALVALDGCCFCGGVGGWSGVGAPGGRALGRAGGCGDPASGPPGLGRRWPGGRGARRRLVSRERARQRRRRRAVVRATVGLPAKRRQSFSCWAHADGTVWGLLVSYGFCGGHSTSWPGAVWGERPGPDHLCPVSPQDPCLSALLLDKLPAPGTLPACRPEAERRCDVCATRLNQLTREALRLLQAPASREDPDAPRGGPGTVTGPRDAPVPAGPPGRQPGRVGPDKRKGAAWPAGRSVQVSVAPAGLGGALSTVTIQAQQCLEGMWSVSRVNSFLPPSCLVSPPGRVGCWAPAWGSPSAPHRGPCHAGSVAPPGSRGHERGGGRPGRSAGRVPVGRARPRPWGRPLIRHPHAWLAMTLATLASETMWGSVGSQEGYRDAVRPSFSGSDRGNVSL